MYHEQHAFCPATPRRRPRALPPNTLPLAACPAQPRADSSMVCTSVQAVVAALARDVGALGICLAGCHYDKIVR